MAYKANPHGLVPGSIEINEIDRSGRVVRSWRDDGEGQLIGADGKAGGIVEYEQAWFAIGEPVSTPEVLWSVMIEAIPGVATIAGIVLAGLGFFGPSAPVAAGWAGVAMFLIGGLAMVGRRLRSGRWL